MSHPDKQLAGFIEPWWLALQQQGSPVLPTKLRAELKRCESPIAAIMTEGFRSLWQRVPESQRPSPYAMQAWATIACMLAHTKSTPDKSASIATLLGRIDKSTDKPAMSELRFAQLQNARSEEEFFIRMVRAVKMLKGQATPALLATDVLAWYAEHHSRSPIKTANRIAVKWAMDYYQ